MKKLCLGALLLFMQPLVLPLMQLNGCTGIKLIADDGSVVHGRTLEFGTSVDLSVAVIPRGYSFTGTTPNGPGLRYKSKYAAVGAIAFSHLTMLDGMNEKGLSVGTFYFPGFAGYSQITRDTQARALSPVEFPNWILTQFATVNELKEALQDVVIAPTVSEEWGPTPPPFHYIVFDKDGNCLVIEPLGGFLVTYDNELGTLTNSPTFDWHMTNLRNYIHLSPYNAIPVSINGITFKQLGAGSGMTGLPGDFTPPSRFVRAAIFSAAATPSPIASDAIFQIFHILNQFDIPVGVALEKIDETTHSSQTQVTCARDPQSLKYYFKTYDDQNIKVIDLSDFDFNVSNVKLLPVIGRGRAQDISRDLTAL